MWIPVTQGRPIPAKAATSLPATHLPTSHTRAHPSATHTTCSSRDTNEVTFDSDYCLEHCYPDVAYIRGISVPLSEKITFVFEAAFIRVSVRQRRHQIIAMRAFTLLELKRVLRICSTFNRSLNTNSANLDDK